MKIEVSVCIREKADAYTFTDVAAAKVETNAPWDEVKPTAIHRALDDVVEDVLARVRQQLKAEDTRRREQQEVVETF